MAYQSLLVFARTDYNGPPLTNLLDIIDHVKPTALLGLSTIKAGVGVAASFSVLILSSRGRFQSLL